MLTITEALIAEHAVFLDVFSQIESILPGARTLDEVRMLAGLVERMLHQHGEAEKNLAYAALDHVLENKGHLDRMHQDHQEIDVCLKRAHTARDLAEASRLLKAAILASREHFRREEQAVFPTIEKALRPDTLGELGNVWRTQRVVPAS